MMIILLSTEKASVHFSVLFIEYLCLAILWLVLIVWLYFHIRRIGIIQGVSNVLLDLELNHVFGKKVLFESVRKFSEFNLCVENIDFFVDIYKIRKALSEDPYA